MNVNREYVFVPTDGGWSYLLHTKHKGEKTVSDLNLDIDDSFNNGHFGNSIGHNFEKKVFNP